MLASLLLQMHNECCPRRGNIRHYSTATALLKEKWPERHEFGTRFWDHQGAASWLYPKYPNWDKVIQRKYLEKSIDARPRIIFKAEYHDPWLNLLHKGYFTDQAAPSTCECWNFPIGIFGIVRDFV